MENQKNIERTAQEKSNTSEFQIKKTVDDVFYPETQYLLKRVFKAVFTENAIILRAAKRTWTCYFKDIKEVQQSYNPILIKGEAFQATIYTHEPSIILTEFY